MKPRWANAADSRQAAREHSTTPSCDDCRSPVETWIVWYDGSILCETCARAWDEQIGAKHEVKA
jgi:hypothetical protein